MKSRFRFLRASIHSSQIVFVLGITNYQQLRAQSINNLVYKDGQAGVRKASVTLVFNNQDKERSPVGYEKLDKITVTR
jgi:structural maintenance of chromosome 2